VIALTHSFSASGSRPRLKTAAGHHSQVAGQPPPPLPASATGDPIDVEVVTSFACAMSKKRQRGDL
jgi:hypothetical protein